MLRESSGPEIGLFAAPGYVGDIVEEARYLDECGVASLWTGDHWDSLVNAGVLAAVTQRAAIGTAVAQLSRPPSQLAVACIHLQILSNNRFRLGLGLGTRQTTEGWHGVPWARRSQRLVEYVEALRALLAARRGSPVTVEGEFYTIREFAGFPDVPPPPIWLAAGGPRALEAAGRVGDGVLLINLLGIPYFREYARNRILQGLHAAGRPTSAIQIGFVRYTAIDSDRATARERARAAIARSALNDYHQTILTASGFGREAGAILDATRRGDAALAAAAVSDDMIDTFAIAGTAEDLRQQVKRYQDDADLLLLHPAAGGLSAKEQTAQNRAIAEAFAGSVASPR